MNTTFALDLAIGDITLRSRLCVPAEPAWASVLLLPGGGLSDGDGNDLDVDFAPLAQWAEHLAEAGLASLRFDRRGIGASGGELAAAATTLEDAIAIVREAQNLPELPAPWCALGAAEGAIWATLLAQHTDQIRALVLVAPPTHPVGDLMHYQQAISQAEASLSDIQAHYAAQAPLFTFEPIFKVRCPVLVLHGERDATIPPACSHDLVVAVARRQAPASLDYLPQAGLDHWLCHSPGVIDSEAVGVLVNWLKQKCKQE